MGDPPSPRTFFYVFGLTPSPPQRVHTFSMALIANCLKMYLFIRKRLVEPRVKEILIGNGMSRKPVTSDRLSRSIKDELYHAVVNISLYKAYSGRSQSLSNARDIGISVGDKMEIKSVYNFFF